jgi:hypothetical protein
MNFASKELLKLKMQFIHQVVQELQRKKKCRELKELWLIHKLKRFYKHLRL